MLIHREKFLTFGEVHPPDAPPHRKVLFPTRRMRLCSSFATYMSRGGGKYGWGTLILSGYPNVSRCSRPWVLSERAQTKTDPLF